MAELLVGLFILLILPYWLLSYWHRRRQKKVERKAKKLVEEWIEEHATVLKRKFHQTKIHDDYGNYLPDGFLKELAYFKDHVLLRNALEKDGKLRSALENLILGDEAYIIELILSRLFENVVVISRDGLTTRIKIEVDMDVDQPYFDENMSPYEFESFCGHLLEDTGWNVKSVGRSGDQGVDLIAETYGRKVVLQCKLYSKPVGNKAVQEALAGMKWEDADFAAVVSNNTYTKSARQLAAKNNIFLLHYDELSRLPELVGVADVT